MNQHILIVEDDMDINNLLANILTKESYQITQAFSGTEAVLQLQLNQYDLILLDLMLPGLTGEALITKIQESNDTPIIVISAKTAIENKVNCLNLGADDYITKPFAKEEILARVNAHLRRINTSQKNNSKSNKLTYRDLRLDTESRSCRLREAKISLTSHEFDLLTVLLKHPKKVFSRDELYNQIWQQGYFGEDNTVNVHISNIRKKFKAVIGEEVYIETVWGIGFKLAEA